jgi:hypothetical protein
VSINGAQSFPPILDLRANASPGVAAGGKYPEATHQERGHRPRGPQLLAPAVLAVAGPGIDHHTSGQLAPRRKDGQAGGQGGGMRAAVRDARQVRMGTGLMGDCVKMSTYLRCQGFAGGLEAGDWPTHEQTMKSVKEVQPSIRTSEIHGAQRFQVSAGVLRETIAITCNNFTKDISNLSEAVSGTLDAAAHNSP